MEGKSNKRGRSIALLVVGVMIGGLLITPAGAHVGGTVGHLWTKHMLPLAKKAFYTKAQTDARYLGKTAKAADSEKLDGVDSTGFLSATGKAVSAAQADSATVAQKVGSVTTLFGEDGFNGDNGNITQGNEFGYEYVSCPSGQTPVSQSLYANSGNATEYGSFPVDVDGDGMNDTGAVWWFDKRAAGSSNMELYGIVTCTPAASAVWLKGAPTTPIDLP